MTTPVTVEELVLATQALQDEARALFIEVDTRVNAVEQSFYGRYANYYIDQTFGSDNNIGDELNPFASLSKVIDTMTTNSFANVYFLNDYHFSENAVAPANHGKKLFLIGRDKENGEKPKLSTEIYELGGFLCFYGISIIGYMPTAIAANNLKFELPESTSALPAHPGNGAFFKSTATGYPSVFSLKLNYCDITAGLDVVGSIVGSGQGMTNLAISSTCTWSTTIPGHFLGGIDAGTDVNTLSNVSSNLATL